MKTKQEQINEMAKYVCNVCDFPCADHKGCSLAEEAVEALYDAGYRKTPDDIREMIDVLYEGATLKEKLDEIKQLKNENKELKAKLEARLTCDFVKTAQKHAQVDVLNKVKVLIFQKDNPYSVPFEEFIRANAFCGYIDELIKEIQND